MLMEVVCRGFLLVDIYLEFNYCVEMQCFVYALALCDVSFRMLTYRFLYTITDLTQSLTIHTEIYYISVKCNNTDKTLHLYAIIKYLIYIYIHTHTHTHIRGRHKRMVRFQKLTRNLFLTLHGHNVHRQQRQLSKFLMRYQQFASHAYCEASFQDGFAAGKGFLCAPF